MSHGQLPPEGGQPRHGGPAAEHAVHPPARPPAETPVETTAPLPPVPPHQAAGRQGQPQQDPAHQQEHRTVGLPLLDLLAPEQPAQPVQPPQPAQSGPAAASPPYGLSAGYEQPSYGVAQPYEVQGYGPPQDPYGSGLYGQAAAYERYEDVAPPPPPPRPRRPGRPGAGLVAALAAGVLLLAVLGIWALSGGRSPERPSGTSSAAAPTSTPIKVVGGYQFTQHAARTDTDCAANAYGKVAELFRTTPCTKVDRALYSTTVDSRIVAVSVSVVQMPTEQAADGLRKLADTNGTGNVNDLLRAGVRVPGGPEKLTDAGYASARDAATVVIAEADFADESIRDEALLDRISEAALQLRR